MIAEPDRYHRGVRRGGRGENLGARRSAAAPAPDRAAHQESWREGGRGHQPVDARLWCSKTIAGDLDHVLVMSVNPGFGGQTFIPRSESKVRAVRQLLSRARIAAHSSRSTAASTVERGASRGGGRRHPGGRSGGLRRRRTCSGRFGSFGRPRRVPRSSEGRSLLHLEPPRPLRGNRQDGRRLLRELLRVVRGGAHRSAALARLELSRDGTGRRRRCR